MAQRELMYFYDFNTVAGFSSLAPTELGRIYSDALATRVNAVSAGVKTTFGSDNNGKSGRGYINLQGASSSAPDFYVDDQTQDALAWDNLGDAANPSVLTINVNRNAGTTPDRKWGSIKVRFDYKEEGVGAPSLCEVYYSSAGTGDVLLQAAFPLGEDIWTMHSHDVPPPLGGWPVNGAFSLKYRFYRPAGSASSVFKMDNLEISGVRETAAGTTISMLNSETGDSTLVSTIAGPSLTVDITDPLRTDGVIFQVQPTNAAVAYQVSNLSVFPAGAVTLTAVAGSPGQHRLLGTAAAAGAAQIVVTATSGGVVDKVQINVVASGTSGIQNPTNPYLLHTADLSAAVLLPSYDGQYAVTADDETNLISIHPWPQTGLPAGYSSVNSRVYDFRPQLQMRSAESELDIEGGTLLGSTIYWISSHGVSSLGDNLYRRSPDKERIFSTRVNLGSQQNPATPSLGSAEAVFSGLRTAVSSQLGTKTVKENASGTVLMTMANCLNESTDPEEANGNGFNIEGLAIGWDNSSALVGLRAPVAQRRVLSGGVWVLENRALMVCIKDFVPWMRQRQSNPALALPANALSLVELPTGTASLMGIRSLENTPMGDFIVSLGAPGGGGANVMVKWDGLLDVNSQPITKVEPINLQTPSGAALSLATAGGAHFEAVFGAPSPLTAHNQSSLGWLGVDSGDVNWYASSIPFRNKLAHIDAKRALVEAAHTRSAGSDWLPPSKGGAVAGGGGWMTQSTMCGDSRNGVYVISQTEGTVGAVYPGSQASYSDSCLIAYNNDFSERWRFALPAGAWTTSPYVREAWLGEPQGTSPQHVLIGRGTTLYLLSASTGQILSQVQSLNSGNFCGEITDRYVGDSKGMFYNYNISGNTLAIINSYVVGNTVDTIPAPIVSAGGWGRVLFAQGDDYMVLNTSPLVSFSFGELAGPIDSAAWPDGAKPGLLGQSGQFFNCYYHLNTSTSVPYPQPGYFTYGYTSWTSSSLLYNHVTLAPPATDITSALVADWPGTTAYQADMIVVGDNGNVTRRTVAGSTVWNQNLSTGAPVPAGYGRCSAPVFDMNGIGYMASGSLSADSGYLTAFNAATGTLIWRVATTSVVCPPLILDDGRICVNTKNALLVRNGVTDVHAKFHTPMNYKVLANGSVRGQSLQGSNRSTSSSWNTDNITPLRLQDSVLAAGIGTSISSFTAGYSFTTNAGLSDQKAIRGLGGRFSGTRLVRLFRISGGQTQQIREAWVTSTDRHFSYVPIDPVALQWNGGERFMVTVDCSDTTNVQYSLAMPKVLPSATPVTINAPVFSLLSNGSATVPVEQAPSAALRALPDVLGDFSASGG